MAVVTEERKQEGGNISPVELEQRMLVLRRFRTLLQEQRDRFRSYLEVLDRQKDIIETGTAGELLAHVELEEKIVADIFSIQKVINPLEDMYRAVRASGGQADREDDVPDLKAALEDLKNEAVIRSGRNRELLSRRMLELRSEIKSLRSNPYAPQKPAFSDMNTASLVDLKG
ncbi:MAG: flagellar biosynthesis protein FlgN [Treponema sp.]|jgi:hypothetical protein|nr:flagellar biosynthesis protein FlgN [Treponema sp.]